MKPFEHERSVLIRANGEHVLNYVSRPENLPLWTQFFKSVTAGSDGSFSAETIVGTTEVQLPVQRTQLGAVVELQVTVNGRKEVARILIETLDHQTSVKFQTGFPATWEPARIAEQLTELTHELERLRDLIESQFEERPQRVVA